MCRLFIFSNNLFIRVCHDNVRVMENIKKCQCKRLAKVSFTPFENRTAFSYNPYQHHHHHHDNHHRPHDNRHRHSDTMSQARFDYFSEGKVGGKPGFKILVNGGVSCHHHFTTFKYFSNMHKIFSRYVKSLVNNGTNCDFSKFSPMST